MSKKDRATVFHTAFNNMSKHYRVLEGSPSDLAKKTGVGVSTISDYQKGTSNMDFSTMERILLNDIVSEKALDFFIEQLKNLLQASRNSQDKEDEDSRGDDCSDLENPVPSTIETGEGLQQSWYRTGQKGFSDNVCANYSNCCCFPNCFIDEHTFLIGAHIARWVDVEELRGDISNGLCLCLMHDKAFESGFFYAYKKTCVLP